MKLMCLSRLRLHHQLRLPRRSNTSLSFRQLGGYYYYNYYYPNIISALPSEYLLWYFHNRHLERIVLFNG